MKNRKVLTEIYSRIAGYFRPVAQWNKGKQEEFDNRLSYKVPEDVNGIPISNQK